jgi:N-acetylmuramoyl-L-alanine amidase
MVSLNVKRLFFASLFLALLHIVPFQADCAKSPVLEAIRVGDYVDRTQITIEHSSSTIVTEVKPLTASPPILLIRLKGLSEGLFAKQYTASSRYLNKINIAREPNGWLNLTVPVSENVDLTRLYSHSMSGMVLVDLPLIEPNYIDFPSPVEVEAFKNKGGHVIVIDPGHGGFDSGAVGGYYTRAPRLKEKDMNLALGLKTKKILDADPRFMCILTRNGDYYPIPPNFDGTRSRKSFISPCLDYRVQMGKELGGELFLSFHLNAPGSQYRSYQKTVRGFEVYYFSEDSASTLVEEWENTEEFEILENSKELPSFLTSLNKEQILKGNIDLAVNITKEIDKIPEMVLRNPAIKPKPYRILRHLSMPSVLLEFLFLTHPTEHEFIRQEKNQERIVQAVYQGIKNYFFEPKLDFALASQDSNPFRKQIPAPTIKASVSNPVFHTVRSGESLDSISKKYGVSVDTLQKANNIRYKNRIKIGQKLLVPGGVASTSNPSRFINSPPSFHTVKSGETLDSISKLYNVSVSELQSANSIRYKNRISIGQKIRIPTNATIAGTAPNRESTPAKTTIVIHTVRSGETLEKIAIRHNTSIASIKSLNNKNSSRIYPGDKLKVIPGVKNTSKEVSYAAPIRYKVKFGDTLSDIAKLYKTSVTTLIQFNRLPNSRLDIGQEIRIPS